MSKFWEFIGVGYLEEVGMLKKEKHLLSPPLNLIEKAALTSCLEEMDRLVEALERVSSQRKNIGPEFMPYDIAELGLTAHKTWREKFDVN